MTQSTALAVRPSWVVRHIARPMTKVLNPVMRTVSGRRHVPMATVFHRGRRSGRAYTTVTGARLVGGQVVIPLTFGTESDWSRNIIGAGGATIRIAGRTYTAGEPETFCWDTNRSLVNLAFPARMRAVFKTLGIRAFLRLQLTRTEPASPDPSTVGPAASSVSHRS